MANNKLLEERERVTREALHTVNFQIRELKRFYSREQVRCWYINRRKLKARLTMILAEKKTQAVAEEIRLRSGCISQTSNRKIQ